MRFIMIKIALIAAISIVEMVIASEASSVEALANINTDFGLRLYRHVANVSGNTFLSPYSISAAMALTFVGASGQTRNEMATVLGLNEIGDSDLNQLYQGLNSVLFNPKPSYTLKMANRIFGDENQDFLEEFVSTLERYYSAPMERLDLSKNPEKSRQHINEWVADKTDMTIRNLLQDGVIDKYTVLVLVNAIYFKGLWKEPFNITETVPMRFTTDVDIDIEVPMMHKNGEFAVGFSSKLNCEILELPYVGGDISMYIILPGSTYGLEAVQNSLSADVINKLLGELQPLDVMLALPKFQISQQLHLEDILKEMGMSTAFSPGADFSGMTNSHEIFISDVVHQAFIQVNEEGTEAAASSIVAISNRMEPYEFVVNRPFLFFIREKTTGSILFLGRVVNPLTTMRASRQMGGRDDEVRGAGTTPVIITQMYIIPLLLLFVRN